MVKQCLPGQLVLHKTFLALVDLIFKKELVTDNVLLLKYLLKNTYMYLH